MWYVTFVGIVLLMCALGKPVPSAVEPKMFRTHEFSLNPFIPQTALFSGLKKLRVKLAEEEPVGQEVANLRFFTKTVGQSGRDAKNEDNFQLFNSEPQSQYFHLESSTGILRIARRIDRDQLCPTFRSCCPSPRLDEVIPSAAFDIATGVADFAEVVGGGYGDVKDLGVVTAQLPECRLDLNVRSDDQYTKIILVHVHIEDINDNSPIWPQYSGLTDTLIPKEIGVNARVMVVKLSENSLVGDSVTLSPAYDADFGVNGVVRYTLSPIIPEFVLQWPVDMMELDARMDGVYSEMNYSPDDTVHSNPSGGKSDVASTDFLEADYNTGQRHELRLVVKKPLDRETQAVYDFTLTAYDGGSPVRNASIPLRVLITDANDNSPKFQKDTYVVELRENARPHTPVIQVVASDADEGLNGRIKYRFSSLTKPDFMRLFTLDSVTGWIHVQWEIDYEVHKKIILTVEAVDSGTPPRASTCIIEVHVLDENDHSPEMRFEPAHLTNYALVPENEKPGRLVAVFTVTDQDSGENGRVACQLTEPHKWRFDTTDQVRVDSMLADPMQSLFKLQQMHVPFSVMYKLSTTSVFDRELTARILVWIVCSDFGQPPRNTTGSVSVRITDANDERPRFARSSYYHSLREDTALSTPVFWINATDGDEGENAQLTYWLTGLDADFFEVNEKTGQVSVRRALDRESRDLLTLQIHCSDHGTPALNASAEVIVAITDVNDNAPEIPEHVEFSVMENHTAVVPIGKLIVADKDQGKNAEVSFSLIQCFAHLPLTDDYQSAGWPMQDHPSRVNFTAVKTNEMLYTFFIAKDGRIYLGHAKLDREKYPMYELMVRAEDHGVPRLSSTSVVKIHILDVNDNAPRFVFPSPNNNTIYVARSAQPGTVVAQLHAIDEDLYENGRVSYELQEDRTVAAASLFSLDSRTGQLRLRKLIDRLEPLTNNPQRMKSHTTQNNSVTERNNWNHSKLGAEGLAGTIAPIPSAYSLFVNAYDGGNPRLKTSTILRVLFTPPFYPPMSMDSHGHLDGRTGSTKGILLENNRTRRVANGREIRKTVWFGSGFLVGDDDMTGIGILLGLVIAVGLFVCFVLLVATILLRQAHHLRRRRRLMNTAASSPKLTETRSDSVPSSLPKLAPPLVGQLVDAQMYTPFVSLYHPDTGQAFLSVPRTGWNEPVTVDQNSM
ncbi:Protocadherin-1 [Fasciola hepatica]|uniref:Protocadherin-1 n=1 Tax=Fasciola hepatica TaxID=6192 RepID=A0A4E0S3T8_FASHE|nr:Protocadherin-1 [Fasciola hepatica]